MPQPLNFPRKERYRPETAEPFALLLERALSGQDGPQSLCALRREAAERFLRYGLPTPLLERWKYTNLPAALRDLGSADGPADLHFAADGGVRVRSLAQALEAEGNELISYIKKTNYHDDNKYDLSIVDLNAAQGFDGLVIDVPEGADIEVPAQMSVGGGEGLLSVRTIIRLGRHSRLTLIERQNGHGKFWKNMVTQIALAPGARLRHCRLQEDGPQAVSTHTIFIRQERGSSYEAYALNAGAAALSRLEIHAALEGPEAGFFYSGASLLRGRQTGDTSLRVDHRAPSCTSSQFVRTVLADRARGVFQGGIRVGEGAQKTDGRQLGNALLLSEGAEMNTCPELEIFADDVKCAHGATIGALDAEALFYMRSRGIPEAQGRGLLIEAFVGEVFEKNDDPDLQALLLAGAQNWLEAHFADQP